MPEYFVTSATEGRGREELLTFIDEINTSYFKSQNQGFIS